MATARLYRGSQRSSRPIVTPMLAWSAVSMLPDADVLGFAFGVAYDDPWGHRGATHSLAFSLVLGLIFGALGMRLQLPAVRTAITAACLLASHGLLDTLTNGGLGCALFWPFDHARHFASWRPIPVSPIGPAFFSARGLEVVTAELLLFSPLLVYALWPRPHRENHI